MRRSNRRSEKREGRVNYPHYPLAGPILFYGAVTLMLVLTLAVQMPRFLPTVEIAGWVSKVVYVGWGWVALWGVLRQLGRQGKTNTDANDENRR